MYDCHCARMQRMLRWEMYKGGSIYVNCCEIMHTCMAKEYTLINCMALGQRIYSLATQRPRMCVCIEKIAEAQQLRFVRAFLSSTVHFYHSYLSAGSTAPWQFLLLQKVARGVVERAA